MLSILPFLLLIVMAICIQSDLIGIEISAENLGGTNNNNNNNNKNNNINNNNNNNNNNSNHNKNNNNNVFILDPGFNVSTGFTICLRVLFFFLNPNYVFESSGFVSLEIRGYEPEIGVVQV